MRVRVVIRQYLENVREGFFYASWEHKFGYWKNNPQGGTKMTGKPKFDWREVDFFPPYLRGTIPRRKRASC